MPTTNHRLLFILIPLLGFLLSLTTTDLSAFDIAALLCALCFLPILPSAIRGLDGGTRITVAAFGFLVLLLLLSLFFVPTHSLIFTLTTFFVLFLFALGILIKAHGLDIQLLTWYRIGARSVSLLGILVWYLIPDTGIGVTVIQGDRLMMLFSDPNVYGAFLVPALLLEIAYSLEHRTNRRQFMISVMSVGLILLALHLTGSRGAYINGGVALLVFMFGLKRQGLITLKKLIAPLIILISVIGVVLSLTDRGELFELRYNASILPRMEIYSWTLETLTDRDIPTLLRGTGGGSFEYFSPKGVSAHNTYLRMLFEHGLLGLTAFMVGILSPLFHFIRRHGKTSTGIALFASLMGLLVHGLVIDTLHMRHLWLLLGLL